MTHDDVRAVLVSGERLPPAAREHLGRCDACLTFAGGLDRVRRAAPALVPAEPPAGLEDRVLAALQAAPAAGPVQVPAAAPPAAPPAATVPLAPRRSFGRRALVRVAAGVAATVAIGVAAVVVTPEDEDRSPRALLAAAATSTEKAGTARVRVEGRTTFVLAVRDAVPNLDVVPEELRERVGSQWDQTVARVREEAAKAQREIAERLRDLRSAVPGLPGMPKAPSLPPLPTVPSLPRSIETIVTFEAEGDVAFGDRLHLAGVVGAGGEASFDLVAVRDGLAVRAGDGSWASAAQDVGPWSAFLASPDALVRVLRESYDVSAEEGTYRFRARSLDGTLLDGEAVVHDERLRSVRLSAAGSTAGLLSWTTTLRVELSDPGARVDAGPVDPRDRRAVPDAAPPPVEVSRLLYPLGSGVRIAVRR